MMRIFIAIDLPKAVKRELGRLLKKLEKKHWKVRWEKAEKLHLTLVFLGWIKLIQNSKCKIQNCNSKLKIIKEAVRKGCKDIRPFEVSFKGFGCFPDFDYPRVIWLGLRGDLKALAALQKAIENNLINSRFKVDKRKFHGHLTLGRIRPVKLRERKEIGRQLKKMREIDFKSEILVDKVTIFESKLSPKSSTYKKLGEIKLAV